MPKKKRRNLKNFSKQNTVVVVCTLMILSFLLGILVSRMPERKPSPVPVEIKKPTLGFIAIIIDDWGYSGNVKEFLETIDIPVAVAVLPKLPYSKAIAQCARKNNKEVMLHLPLEPHYNADKYPKDYIIKTSMRTDKIRKIIDESLATVPYAQGINNHMGSKATESKELLKIVFAYFKEKDFFIVDSFVSEKSVCKDVAQGLGLPFIRRDVFLDNVADRHTIEGEFAKLEHLAQKNGYAVGIGHARPLTLQVIKEQSKILKNKGFVFLTVKDIIKRAKTIKNP
jgi:polysaccharide deacetylase 2 family uncharacterized protein YibQ